MKICRRNYIVLFLLVALFAAPGLSAYFLYNHNDWLGAPKTNKGRLLSPPILLTQPGTNTKWRLVLWSPGACDKGCIQQLDKLARIRLALGRRLYNVEFWLLLGVDAPPLPDRLAHAAREQDIRVLKLSYDAFHQSSELPDFPEIFIMNPDNYLVLAYQMTSKPDDIFHDIKHLLNIKE